MTFRWGDGEKSPHPTFSRSYLHSSLPENETALPDLWGDAKVKKLVCLIRQRDQVELGQLSLHLEPLLTPKPLT